MLATYINTLAIIIGSLIGITFKRFISDRFKIIIFQSTGLASLIIGILMVVRCKEPVLVVFSIILGGIIGEILKIENGLEKIGSFLKKIVKRKENTFIEAYVDTTLLYCVGAMAIIGSINSANGDYNLLLTKSIMDGTASIIFASILGIGVLFSSISVLIYQGLLTILSKNLIFLKDISYTNEISGAGGALVICIGLNLLEIKKIKIGNLLPSILLIILMMYIKINYFNH